MPASLRPRMKVRMFPTICFSGLPVVLRLVDPRWSALEVPLPPPPPALPLLGAASMALVGSALLNSWEKSAGLLWYLAQEKESWWRALQGQYHAEADPAHGLLRC
jgi:hypothetical protein